MAEDNNIFGEFGERNAKFEELLKKYQTIDENGELVPEWREARAVEPVQEPDYSDVSGSDEAVDDSQACGAVDEPVLYNAAAVVEPQAEPVAFEPSDDAKATVASPVAEALQEDDKPFELFAAEPEVSHEPQPAESGGLIN